MEAALRGMLESTFGEFVEGLDRANAASFPMTLKDLKLKEKRIQEELDEDGNFPFDLSDGSIGNITVTPGWMGTVEVVATNVVLNFSFSPMKAMNKAMRKDSDDEEEQFQPVRAAPAPQAADVAPRFCQKHFTSAQREKIDPTMRSCRQCGINITSTYAAMKFCPPCSNTEERCMICGDFAPVAGNYIPPKTLNPQNPQSAPAGAVYAMPDPMGSYGQRGSAALPPPPPASASQSPSRRMADDWRMGFGSPGSQPPPPPPPPSKGRAGAGPSHSDRPHNTSRAPPREKGVNPPILLQAELSAAEVGGGAKDGGTLQAMYSSATGQIDGLFEYISNSLPLDIHAWTTCLNSGDQRSDVKEFGTSPKTRRRPVMRA